jgi:hypothetical protein
VDCITNTFGARRKLIGRINGRHTLERSVPTWITEQMSMRARPAPDVPMNRLGARILAYDIEVTCICEPDRPELPALRRRRRRA